MSSAVASPDTARPEPAATPARRARLRIPLSVKLGIALVGLVTLVLLINGAVNLWLNYEEAKRTAIRVQQEKAQAATERVNGFISDIESQIGWTTRTEWRRVPLEQQRYDFIRLLRQAPAVTEVSYLDPSGREQLKVSRLEPDTVGSGKDFSAEPRFARAIADKVWFGPVYFRRGSEPYMTVAVAHAGRNPGVTTTEVNLKLIWDVITAIKVGEKGYAFVVTSAGRLIAHPDLSLVLRDTDLSGLPQVARALPTDGKPALVGPAVSEVTTDLSGQRVLTASAPIGRVGWLVFVQSPVSEALAPVYRSLTQALMLLGLGLLLATIVGSFLARRMAVPIQRLQEGAERLGGGDLSERIVIRTGDEIETLADRFNSMAGRIQESYETLEAKVEERTRDLNESLQQQTATADVLKVISRSTFDLQPVLDTLIESATRLCEADHAWIFLREDDHLRWAASFGHEKEVHARIEAYFRPLKVPMNRGSVTGRAAHEGRIVHVTDVLADPEYTWSEAQKIGGYRAALGVPLLREGSVAGVIFIAKDQPAPFTTKQIEFVTTFADQAVIALENVRLFEEVQARTRELGESLKQQTATAEVLQAISRSTFDLEVVLETLVDSAAKLCESDIGSITRQKGEVFYRAAMHGFPAEFAAAAARIPVAIDDSTVTGRALKTGQVTQIHDVTTDPAYAWKEAEDAAGFRTLIGVPLLREGIPIGAFALGRHAVRPYSERQIELVKTFADQAVIAIENARLFEEVQARTRDLSEALEQQTATADVLKVISRSAFDLRTVFETLIETAARLCASHRGVIFLRRGELLEAAAFHSNVRPDVRDYILAHPLTVDETSATGRAALTGQVMHVRDFATVRDYGRLDIQRKGEYRSLLCVPLLREGESLGVFTLPRSEPGGFSPREIELVQTFADQAVIAIENVRLFEEVQARTRDLSEALEQQTATAEVLKVISRSAFDLGTVFRTLIETAARLCGTDRGIIFLRRGDLLEAAASHGAGSQEFRDYVTAHPLAIDGSTASGRAALTGSIVQVRDLVGEPNYGRSDIQQRADFRSVLCVPLMREGKAIGVFTLPRPSAGEFAQREVEIVQTFADQAVIAIENVRLFEEVQTRTRELAQSLDELRMAQDRLVQSEKLASLGQLTAGIAHEIKNPLNFVNNFASVSADLIDELNEALASASLDDKTREEVDELTGMLKGNLEKVVSHGKRADSIVKNMLLHSREGSGEHRLVDVNALVEESMNLAYHGARAEKPGFNVTLVKTLDPSAGEVDLYPQEITRVLLNLIGNGFYAATKKAATDGSFEPTLSASTRSLGDKVEIRIRDNGTGISDDVKAKMFNPFFTTKPAGEGTGLGLSLSHDIVVKQHGGTIEVETEPGAFTEFTIVLPRGGAVTSGKSGP